MRSLNIISVAVVVVLCFLCPTVSRAGMDTMTDARLFRLELQLEPTQPVVGNNAAILTVSDARTNRKIDDAVIEIALWMTVHSHGSPKKPEIKKAGDGRYHVGNLYYTMEGDWDLLVTIQNDNSRDTATFSISNVKKR